MWRLPRTSTARTAGNVVRVVVRETVLGLSVAMRYYNRRRRERRSSHATIELVACVVVVVGIVATLVVFLLIYHDFPLRVSGP